MREREWERERETARVANVEVERGKIKEEREIERKNSRRVSLVA